MATKLVPTIPVEFPAELLMTDRAALQAARDEVLRELNVRKRCFPRWVQEGRMSQTDAADRVERLECALTMVDRVLGMHDTASNHIPAE